MIMVLWKITYPRPTYTTYLTSKLLEKIVGGRNPEDANTNLLKGHVVLLEAF
jgi:hypothetical protein